MVFNSGKRGQVQALLLFGIVGIVLGITIIIGFKISDTINDNFQDSSIISPQAKEGIQSFRNTYPTVFDGTFMFAIVLLGLVVVVSVFAVDSHPIFFAISLPAFFAVLFVNAILANILDDIGKTSTLSSLYAQLPMMNFVAGHWLMIITVVGMASFVALFAKRQVSV